MKTDYLCITEYQEERDKLQNANGDNHEDHAAPAVHEGTDPDPPSVHQ